MKSPLKIAALVLPLLVILIVCCVRVPFLSNPLIGEEGYFGFLAVSPTDGPLHLESKFLLIAHIGEELFFDNAEHPVIPYLFLTNIIRKLFVFNSFSSMQLTEKSIVGRVPFLAIFLVAVLFLCLLYGYFLWQDTSAGTLTFVVLVFTMTSPLLVGGSIQPQIDGSVGVLFLTMSALGIFLAFHFFPGKRSGFCFFLSGFFASLGKNEWFLSFFLSLTISFFIYLVVSRYLKLKSLSLRKLFPGLILSCIGLSCGLLVSYSASPYNFLQGLDVMLRFKAQSSQRGYIETLEALFPWIWQLFLLLLFNWSLLFIQLKKDKKLPYDVFMLLIWSSLMTGAYILSRWIGDGFPRYFCPSLVIAVLCSLLILRKMSLNSLFFRLAISVFGLLICLNCSLLYSYYSNSRALGSCPGAPLSEQEHIITTIYEHGMQKNQPIWAPVAVYYYHRDLDFFEISLSKQAIFSILKHRNTDFQGVRKRQRKLRMADWIHYGPKLLKKTNIPFNNRDLQTQLPGNPK